jgi:rhodanese-related sulfurtransferase
VIGAPNDSTKKIPMKKGYQALIDEASAEITTYSVQQACAKRDDPNVVLIDLRDPRELEREGIIPGALHAPRGMLEFWIDPASPYFKPIFGEAKEFIFFCAAGWRSALATKTAQDMGLTPVADIAGGFTAWKAAGAPVAEKVKKP